MFIAAVAFWQGYRAGDALCTERHQREVLRQIEEFKQRDAERIKILHERDELVRRLEEAANKDPVIVQRCLGPGRVRRLNGLN